MDLQKLFRLDGPFLDILLRGTVMYLALFLMLRLVLKRQGTNLTDLLVIVLIADAAQNALAGPYDSITSGLLLVAVILFWAFTLDWLGFRFPVIGRLVSPPPLPLIEDGRLNRRNMRRELITEEELGAMLRQQGIEGIENVKQATLEANGELGTVQKR